MALPRPIPTNPPSARGLNQYFQGSSATDPRYSNYVNTSPMSNPSNQVNAYGTPLYQGSVLGARTTPIVQTNPYTGEFLQSTDDLGGLGATTGEPTGDAGVVNIQQILNDQLRMAQERANQFREAIDRQLGTAKGYRDEIYGRMGEKRKQFETAFNEGEEDILQAFQGRMGEANTAQEGLVSRNRAGLQAMGLSGSALSRAQGRETQAAAKALGAGQDQREGNKRQNRDIRQTNMGWAQDQESAADREYGNAQEWGRQQTGIADKMVGEAQNSIRSDMSGWLQSLLDRQTALNMSGLQNISAGADKYVAPVFGASMGDLTGFMNGQLGGNAIVGASQPQAANIDPRQQELLKLINSQPGGSMYK